MQSLRRWGSEMTTMASAASDKPTIVLVHGAFQDGKNTWSRVAPRLNAKGYKTFVVTLPGRDHDGVDVGKLSLEIYRDTVVKEMNATKDPVILVGHSFGGITISNVAEAAPDKIKALVYLSAYLPGDGQSLQSLAATDTDSGLAVPGNFILSADYRLASIKDEAKADIFANDANAPDRAAIVASLIPEPAGPQTVAVKLSAERFGKVSKYYIETTKDHCVSPALQERMIKATPVKAVFKLDAGHASYITRPDELADIIETIAREK